MPGGRFGWGSEPGRRNGVGFATAPSHAGQPAHRRRRQPRRSRAHRMPRRGAGESRRVIMLDGPRPTGPSTGCDLGALAEVGRDERARSASSAPLPRRTNSPVTITHARVSLERHDRVLLDEEDRCTRADLEQRGEQRLDDDRREPQRRFVEQEDSAARRPAGAPIATICCSPPESAQPSRRRSPLSAGKRSYTSSIE